MRPCCVRSKAIAVFWVGQVDRASGGRHAHGASRLPIGSSRGGAADPGSFQHAGFDTDLAPRRIGETVAFTEGLRDLDKRVLQGGEIDRVVGSVELTADVEAIRAASRQRYATPVTEIDGALHTLVSGDRNTSSAANGEDLAPKRRRKTGGTP